MANPGAGARGCDLLECEYQDRMRAAKDGEVVLIPVKCLDCSVLDTKVAPEADVETCEYCAYMRPGNEGCECRKNSPVASCDANGVPTMARWPAVRLGDWCGEHIS